MTTTSIDRTESELRAAARRRGLTMKELAVKMGVSASYLSQIANGRRPWTPKIREKVAAVLGEVPGQGTVYRQGGVVTGESSFIRERARTLGMTMQDLADRVGVSYSYMTQVARGRQSMGVKVQARVESTLQAPAKVAPAKCANRQGVVVAGESSYIRERARELGLSLRDLADRVGVSYSYMSIVARGHSNMGVKVQARMESALEAPAKVAPAQPACIDREAVWDRMNAHGFSQNEVARRAGISSANLSQIMNGRNNPSPVVLKKLHGVLFQPTTAERVMPAEVKVLGWRKGERSGIVVRGAGGPRRGSQDGGGAVRVGGRVPWGAKAEFAYRAGYDGMGRVSVTHVVERGYSAMLKQPEMAAAQGSMTYRMMGGCLGAAWDGPHRAVYASPAVGGPSHVQAFAFENVLIPAHTRGTDRRDNREYTRLVNQAARQRHRGNHTQALQLRKLMQQLPSRDPYDPGYRRLRYVRYADDFVLGFIGPKVEAQQVKETLETFLRDTLKLELSREKTLITHATSQAARFLGYELVNQQANDQFDPTGRRRVNGRIGLRVPADVIEQRCQA